MLAMFDLCYHSCFVNIILAAIMRNLNVVIILCLDYLKPRIRQYVSACQRARVLLRIELCIVANMTENSTYVSLNYLLRIWE